MGIAIDLPIYHVDSFLCYGMPAACNFPASFRYIPLLAKSVCSSLPTMSTKPKVPDGYNFMLLLLDPLKKHL